MKTALRWAALLLVMTCCGTGAMACGKKSGLSVDREQIMEQLEKSADLAQESKDAAAESRKVAAAEARNAAAEEKAKQAEPVPVETKAPVEEVPMDDWSLYSAPAKTAEVYDPASAENNELKVFGASNSDGKYLAVYGECALGATVSIENEEGVTFTVQSFGGAFAARIQNPDMTPSLKLSQSYNGQTIGEPITWEGRALLPEYGKDWGVWIGGGNQGFFHKMIPDFEHTNLMDEATQSSVRDRYAGRVEKLKTVGDGCEMIALLIPSAMTVYPELVPAEVAVPGEGESRFDQMVQVLTEAGVKVIDMREIFTAHKNDELPLYYRYDSHWADYGAYLAYVALYDYISDRYPDAAPRTFDEFDWTWGRYTGGDMPYYFDIDYGGLVYEKTYVRTMKFDVPDALKSLTRYKKADSLGYSSYSDEIVSGGSYDTGRENLPDIYVFRNSYGAHLYDLLLERSNRATFHPTFSYTYNLAQIKTAAPDYVIYVMSEWDFPNLINN
ncbi:MAG: hypothetical protein ACI4V1_06790 [Eubacteriales bacterium]